MLPGPIPIVFERFYSSSRNTDVGATLGAGWAHAFEQHVAIRERTLQLRDEEGRTICFAQVQPGGETFHRRERLILRRPSENEYRVCSVDTRQTKVFTVEGTGDQALLRSVEDPFGNRVLFGYDGARLRQIVDASGARFVSTGTKDASSSSRSNHPAHRFLVLCSPDMDNINS